MRCGMIKKTVTVLKYIARFCVAMIHVITGKKHKDGKCDCTENSSDKE